MRRILHRALWMGLFVLTARGEETTTASLSKAVLLEGQEYWKARQEIVGQGAQIVPELAQVQADKNADWKLQLMDLNEHVLSIVQSKKSFVIIF